MTTYADRFIPPRREPLAERAAFAREVRLEALLLATRLSCLGCDRGVPFAMGSGFHVVHDDGLVCSAEGIMFKLLELWGSRCL